MQRNLLSTLSIGILTLGVIGCHPRARVKPPEPETQTLAPTQEPSLRDKQFHEVQDVNMVYFDLNKADLRSDAMDTLKRNYDVLAQHTDWDILVEGHCDQRGTTNYNLGLGQLRAEAVRKYYISLGISAGRIATISYGKERPLCAQDNEACWSKNRRAVTKVAEKSKAQ